MSIKPSINDENLNQVQNQNEISLQSIESSEDKSNNSSNIYEINLQNNITSLDNSKLQKNSFENPQILSNVQIQDSARNFLNNENHADHILERNNTKKNSLYNKEANGQIKSAFYNQVSSTNTVDHQNSKSISSFNDRQSSLIKIKSCEENTNNKIQDNNINILKNTSSSNSDSNSDYSNQNEITQSNLQPQIKINQITNSKRDSKQSLNPLLINTPPSITPSPRRSQINLNQNNMITSLNTVSTQLKNRLSVQKSDIDSFHKYSHNSQIQSMHMLDGIQNNNSNKDNNNQKMEKNEKSMAFSNNTLKKRSVQQTSKSMYNGINKQLRQHDDVRRKSNKMTFTALINLLITAKRFVKKITFKVKGIKSILSLDQSIINIINDRSFNIDYIHQLSQASIASRQKLIQKENSEIILSFNTGFYLEGKIITDKKRITKHYFKNYLLSDILVLIPQFVYYFMNENSNYTTMVIAFFLEFLIFLKIFSLKDTFRRLERVAAENEHIAQLFPLFTLWVQILILAHIICLFYHSIAVVEIEFNNEDKTWLQTQNLMNKDWTDKYLHSLYWSVSTMCTIFIYMPETNIEILFVIFSIFLMTGVFGYALNTIGLIITDIDKKSKEYKNERSKVNRFFKKKCIPLKLRDRVSEYLHFQFRQKQLKNRDEQDEILQKLSKSLKSEILKQVNKNHIEKFNFLLQNFSQEKQDQIVEIIKEESFSPDEFIIKNQKLSNIYIISKGNVEIQFQRDQESNILIGKKLNQGDIFGVQEFFSGQSITHTIKSIESCEIIKIEKSQFMQIFSNKDLDYEQLLMLKDYYIQNIYREDIQMLNICLICKQKGHIYNNCNKCTYQPNMDSIVYDYKSLNIQIRRNWDRFPERTYNARSSYQDNIDGVEEIFDEDNVDQEFRYLAISYQKFYESHSDQAILQIENKINEIKEKMHLVEEENQLNQNYLLELQTPELQQRNRAITLSQKNDLFNNQLKNGMDKSDVSVMRKSIRISGGGNDDQKVQRLQKRFSLRMQPGQSLFQKRGSVLIQPNLTRRQSRQISQQNIASLACLGSQEDQDKQQQQEKQDVNNNTTKLQLHPSLMNTSLQKKIQESPQKINNAIHINLEDSLNEIIETEESVKPNQQSIQQFTKSRFNQGKSPKIFIKKQPGSPYTNRMGQSRMGQSRMGMAQSRFRDGFRQAITNTISSNKRIDTQKSSEQNRIESQVIVNTPLKQEDKMDNGNENQLQKNLNELKKLHNQKKLDTWDLFNFDKLKKFKIYMPYNNINEIIKNIYQIQRMHKSKISGITNQSYQEIQDDNIVDNINNLNDDAKDEQEDQILKQKMQLDIFLKKQQFQQN